MNMFSYRLVRQDLHALLGRSIHFPDHSVHLALYWRDWDCHVRDTSNVMNTVLGHEDQPELSVKVFGSKISLYEEQGGNDCYITSEHLDSDLRPFFSPCSPSFLGSAAIRPPTSMLLQSALGLAYIRPLIDLQPPCSSNPHRCLLYSLHLLCR